MTYKRKCVTSFTALSILLLMLMSTYSVQAVGQVSECSPPPGMPEHALQYNRTDITPSGYMETVQAMKTNVFFYRNVTLMMNTTRNYEMNVTVDPQVRERIISVSVDSNKTVTLAINVSGSTIQGEAVMERALNFYMELEPNATLQLQAQLRLFVNQTELAAELGREVNASRLTWMYWNQTQEQWIPVESHIDQNGYLVCNTNHFSTWTVAEMESPEDVPENITVFTVVALAAIATIAVTSLKRKKSQEQEK